MNDSDDEELTYFSISFLLVEGCEGMKLVPHLTPIPTYLSMIYGIILYIHAKIF